MVTEDLKKILLSLKEEDYYNIADFHVHSSESDGRLSPYEIIEQAKKRQLKHISIADHNTIDAYTTTNILSENIVIPAVEFDCYYKGSMLHIIGLGIDIDNKELKTIYSPTKAGRTHNLTRLFKMREPKSVITKIKNAGGIAIWAHPACCWYLSLESILINLIKMGLEGIEVYYPYRGLRGILKFHSKETVKELAEKYNLIKTGGTDSHGKKLLV